MAEIKNEVEYVIKTGRQVVEKKQVDFPDKLNAQLDAIKLQYNELGGLVCGNISSSKILFHSLFASSSLRLKANSLSAWVNGCGEFLISPDHRCERRCYYFSTRTDGLFL